MADDDQIHVHDTDNVAAAQELYAKIMTAIDGAEMRHVLICFEFILAELFKSGVDPERRFAAWAEFSMNTTQRFGGFPSNSQPLPGTPTGEPPKKMN